MTADQLLALVALPALRPRQRGHRTAPAAVYQGKEGTDGQAPYRDG
jgi:hypothetical protein